MRPEYLVWAAAAVIGIVGSARVTRLVTMDKFPLSVKLRIWWDNRVSEESNLWNPLLHCPWCLGPWVVLVNLAAALLSDLHPAWWLLNGWMAASYAASWIVFHDED